MKESSMRVMERTELMAELFRAATGFLAPGKAVPPDIHSDQYELDRQVAWLRWTDTEALDMAMRFIQALRDKEAEYDQLYGALEACDTNQLRQERDNLRMRIKAVDEEHAQLQVDRQKMIQAYTALEGDRDFYKKMWGIRGKALEMPCLACGYTGQAIRLKNGEIP